MLLTSLVMVAVFLLALSGKFSSSHFSLREFLVFFLGHLLLFLMLFAAIANLSLTFKSLLLAFLGVLAGFLFADFFTGFYHFILDNFKWTKVPVLEKQAKEFQGHHLDPLDITRQNLGSLFYGPMWGVILYFFLAFIPGIFLNFGVWFMWFSVGYPLFASYSQLFHMQTHRDSVSKLKKRNKLVAFLRKLKILIKPEHHMKHHNNFHQNYEIVSGLATKLTNPIYKWIHQKILKR